MLWKRNWIYVWSYDPGAADFIQILEKQGLKKGSYITGMALPLTYWTYQAQEIPNLEVKPLRTKSDFAWFGEVVLPTFGLKDEAGGSIFADKRKMRNRTGIPALRWLGGWMTSRSRDRVTEVLVFVQSPNYSVYRNSNGNVCMTAGCQLYRQPNRRPVMIKRMFVPITYGIIREKAGNGPYSCYPITMWVHLCP